MQCRCIGGPVRAAERALGQQVAGGFGAWGAHGRVGLTLRIDRAQQPWLTGAA